MIQSSLAHVIIDCRKPDWDNLACLLILVVHYRQLEPYLPDDATRSQWIMTEAFKRDYAAAIVVVQSICSRAGCELLGDALETQLEDFKILCEDSTLVADKRVQRVKVCQMETFRKYMGQTDDYDYVGSFEEY